MNIFRTFYQRATCFSSPRILAVDWSICLSDGKNEHLCRTESGQFPSKSLESGILLNGHCSESETSDSEAWRCAGVFFWGQVSESSQGSHQSDFKQNTGKLTATTQISELFDEYGEWFGAKLLSYLQQRDSNVQSQAPSVARGRDKITRLVLLEMFSCVLSLKVWSPVPIIVQIPILKVWQSSQIYPAVTLWQSLSMVCRCDNPNSESFVPSS